MVNVQTMRAPAMPQRSLPVNRIDLADLGAALGKGIDDFRARPSHYAFLALIYPIVGIALGLWTSGASAWPMLYPLMAGFALVGPLAALGFYEISRRREQGLDSSWPHAFEVFRSPSMPGIAAIALLLVALFLAWILTAQALYTQMMGLVGFGSIDEFLASILTTQAGWSLIVVGNLLGFMFAVIAFCVSVVSLPLLLDREVSVGVAINTSVRAVRTNVRVMAIWGLIVAGLLFAGSLPLFVGLAVVVPVLGHSTWHLYRRLVNPTGADAGPAS